MSLFQAEARCSKLVFFLQITIITSCSLIALLKPFTSDGGWWLSMYMFHRMAPVYLHHTSTKSILLLYVTARQTKKATKTKPVSLYQLPKSGALDTHYRMGDG